MRTLLICHEGAALDREGLVRWLASFSTVVGLVVIREAPERRLRRIGREIRRVGWWRFVDVVAFRVYSRFADRAADRRWEQDALARLRARFPSRPDAPEILVTSPNVPAAETFIRNQRPDLVIARCKTLLAPQVFSAAPLGTFALHPGICPEYRNAHGCFWALANGDLDNVGMTLLKIDRGVDTGPVYAQFRLSADPALESHNVTQHRAVVEHLDAIRETLLAIAAGHASPLATDGRRSAAWGQPWLSAYVRMRWRGRTRPGSQGLRREGRGRLKPGAWSPS